MEDIIVKIFEAVANATGLNIAVIAAIFAILYGLSELIGMSKLESNAVYQLIASVVKQLFNKFNKKS